MFKRRLILALVPLFIALGLILQFKTKDSPFGKMASAQTPDPSTVVDVVFVGENFTESQLEEYHTVVQNFIDTLLSYEPFKSRASQFSFHIIDNTTDLGCNDLFDCSGDYIYRTSQVVINSGYPVDTAALIINTTKGGGTASTSNIEMTVTGKSYPHTFVHEFGHSFGGLRDEYIQNSGDGTITNTTLANCYRGIPPAAEWEDVVAIQDYWPGCGYQNWYRPYFQSVMTGAGNHFFNGPSQNLINQKITTVAGAISDSNPPLVSISEPLDNATVSGVISVKSIISDNLGVGWADMKVDGVLTKSIYLPPFDFTLDTSNLSVGLHTISVRGRDSGQNIGIQEINVNVVIPTPTPTPTPIPVTISFTSNNFSARENNKNASMQVALSRSVQTVVRVDYAVSGGTAVAGSDYNITSGTLIFPAGTTSKTISMNLINDRVSEPDETIIVSLSNPQGAGLTLGAIPTSTFTILNDDR